MQRWSAWPAMRYLACALSTDGEQARFAPMVPGVCPEFMVERNRGRSREPIHQSVSFGSACAAERLPHDQDARNLESWHEGLLMRQRV
jgi:hypothetical protein